MSSHSAYVARGCLNKRLFDSELHALAGIRGQVEGWKAYKCKYCAGWHLTSGRRKAARKARRALRRGEKHE